MKQVHMAEMCGEQILCKCKMTGLIFSSGPSPLAVFRIPQSLL